MQNFSLVTSINLAGSQNDIGSPILGIGDPHVQITLLGFPVSSLPGDTRTPQIVIGNKQLQLMSVIGFTNLPVHLAKVKSILELNNIKIKQVRLIRISLLLLLILFRSESDKQLPEHA